MFRFTIRDVLWLTVVVALAVGWILERRRSGGLERRIELAENDAQQSRQAIKIMHEDLDRLEQALPPHGLTLDWSRDMRPTLQDLPPDANRR
jgi:hypothetical protein